MFLFYCLTYVFVIFTNFSNPYVPTLVSGIFVKASLHTKVVLINAFPTKALLPHSQELMLYLFLFFGCLFSIFERDSSRHTSQEREKNLAKAENLFKVT